MGRSPALAIAGAESGDGVCGGAVGERSLGNDGGGVPQCIKVDFLTCWGLCKEAWTRVKGGIKDQS